MAAPIQRIFPRLGTSALSFVRKPTAALGGWNQTNIVFARGAGARYVGPEEGAAQLDATPIFAAIPNATTHALLLGQFLGDPLKEQVIPAGTWRVAFAAKLANAGANFRWQGRAALIVVDGQSGGRRATIFDTSAIGSGLRAGTGELTCLEDVTGLEARVRTGDYLSLELGIAVTNSAGALAPQATLYCDGTAPISSDGVSATSAMSVLEAPAELPLSLPQAGEQPNPSVTHAQAVRLLQEAWPPHSEVLYAWDEDNAHVKKYMDWLGDLTKLYGHDQVDRIFRELSPLRCMEQLGAWESLLGIAQTRAAQRDRSAAERRRVILARIRELGPLTLHNLAAIFYSLANYSPGSRPDVYELDRLDIELMHTWSETLAAPAAIPDDVTFGIANLIRDTPAFLEGGEVSDAGVTLTLVLSNTDTSALRIMLVGPDFATATWGGDAFPIPSGLASTLKLRAGAGSPSSHVGRGVQGSWRILVYKTAGAPAVNLIGWSLLVQGKRHGGRGQGKLQWAVHLDSAHQRLDRRDVESTLDRITQSYARGFCVYSTRARPGEQINGIGVHRAGRFLPGS